MPGKRLFTLSLALLLLTACSRLSSDLLLAETGWTVRLPKVYQRAPFPESDDRLVHRYQREAIVDDSDIAVHPNISLSIESVPVGTDPVLFSASKHRFQVLEVYAPASGLYSVNAIGYLATYSAPFDGQDVQHRIYVLHAVQGTHGIEIILDATESVFPHVQSEFLSVMKSLTQSNV